MVADADDEAFGDDAHGAGVGEGHEHFVTHLNSFSCGVDLLRGILTGVWSYPAWLDVMVIVGFAVGAATYAVTRTEERYVRPCRYRDQLAPTTLISTVESIR